MSVPGINIGVEVIKRGCGRGLLGLDIKISMSPRLVVTGGKSRCKLEGWLQGQWR